MEAIPSLACVLIDKFSVDTEAELRPSVAHVVKSPHGALCPNKKHGTGVASITDASKIQKILSKLGNVWLEFETLYRWAKANDSNRSAAAELWEETEMLARLIADDPDYFKKRNIGAFANADTFCSSKEFVSLCRHARKKNNVYQSKKPRSSP